MGDDRTSYTIGRCDRVPWQSSCVILQSTIELEGDTRTTQTDSLCVQRFGDGLVPHLLRMVDVSAGGSRQDLHEVLLHVADRSSSDFELTREISLLLPRGQAADDFAAILSTQKPGLLAGFATADELGRDRDRFGRVQVAGSAPTLAWFRAAATRCRSHVVVQPRGRAAIIRPDLGRSGDVCLLRFVPWLTAANQSWGERWKGYLI